MDFDNIEENDLKITKEELKKFKGLEKISDDESKKIIDGLYRMAIISYKLYKENDTYEH